MSENRDEQVGLNISLRFNFKPVLLPVVLIGNKVTCRKSSSRQLQYVMNAEANSIKKLPKCLRYALNAATVYTGTKIAPISLSMAGVYIVIGMEPLQAFSIKIRPVNKLREF